MRCRATEPVQAHPKNQMERRVHRSGQRPSNLNAFRPIPDHSVIRPVLAHRAYTSGELQFLGLVLITVSQQCHLRAALPGTWAA